MENPFTELQKELKQVAYLQKLTFALMGITCEALGYGELYDESFRYYRGYIVLQ